MSVVDFFTSGGPIEKLQTAIKELDTVSGQNIQAAEEVRDRVIASLKEYKKDISVIDGLNEQKTMLEGKLQLVEQRITELEAEKEDLTVKYNTLNVLNSTLNSMQKEKDNDIQKLKEEKDQLQQEIRQLSSSKGESDQQLKKLQQFYEEREQKLKEREESINSLQEQINVLTENNDKLDSIVSLYSRQSDKLNSTLLDDLEKLASILQKTQQVQALEAETLRAFETPVTTPAVKRRGSLVTKTPVLAQ